MNKTTSSRRKRWFFARSMARAYQEWLEKRTRTVKGSGKKAKQRPLFAEALEPRVLFSGTPVPVEEVEGQDEQAQQAATAQSAELLDAGIEGISEFSFDENIDADFTEEDLERLAAEAVARWEESGLTEEQVAALEEISYVVTDLEGSALAYAEGNSIYIDSDAAGYDWFVDDTEWLDEEFVEIDGILRAASGGDIDGLARDGIDMLSVLMHEQGHILGLLDEHELGLHDSTMYGLFDEGERRIPGEGLADGAVPGTLKGTYFASTAFIQPDNVSYTGSNSINTPDVLVGGASSVSSSQVNPSGGGSGTSWYHSAPITNVDYLTFDFSSPVDIGVLHLWDYYGHSPSDYQIAFFDGAGGTGTNIGTENFSIVPGAESTSTRHDIDLGGVTDVMSITLTPTNSSVKGGFGLAEVGFTTWVPTTTTVGVDGSGNLMITDSDGGDTDDSLTIVIDGTDFHITDATNSVDVRIAVASVTGDIIVNGSSGDDTLTIDFSGGLITQAITFNGGAGGNDDLVLTGGSFATATYNYINGNDGTIELSGNGLITYTGLEPIDMTGSTVTDFVFNLPAGADNAQLSESGGFLTLESTDGTPTFESTTFAAPSGSITINGQAGDVLTVSSALNLAANNTDFILNVPAINLNGSINNGTGDQTFDGDVTLGALDITLTAGAVNFNGNTTLVNSDDFELVLDATTVTSAVGKLFDVNDGRLKLDGGTEFINNGNLETGVNGSVPIFASLETGNKITNNGTFIHNGNSLRLYVEIVNNGTLTVDNPSGSTEIQFRPGGTNGPGGKITNNGTLNISDEAARFDLSGTIVNRGGGIINATGTSVIFAEDLTVTNESGGTVNLSAGAVTVDDTTLTNNSGGILNLNDGSLILSNGASVISAGTTNLVDTNYTIGGTGTFTNDGTLNLTPTSADRDLILNATLRNNGTTNYTLADDHFVLSGSGSFENAGAFEHIKGSGNDNFHLDDFTFNNLSGGVYRFHGGGDIEISGNGVFNNAGILERTATAGDDSVIFDFGTGTNGSFNNLAGGIVQSLGGILHIAAQKGNTSDAASQWIANGGDLRIGGTWEGAINGSSSTANGGRVEITNQSNGEFFENVKVGAAGLTINITDAGFLWDDSNIDTQGNAFTNDGIMTISGAAAKALDGTLTNNGTLNIEGDVAVTDGDIVNASGGNLNFTSGTVNLTNAADIILNQSGGTLSISGSGTKAVLGNLTNEGDASLAASITVTGGDIVNASGGTLAYSDGAIVLTNPGDEIINQSGGTFNIIAGATKSLTGGELRNESGGTLDFQSGTVTLIGATDVIRNEAGGIFTFSTAGTSAIAGGGLVINDSGATMTWADGRIDIDTNATLQNDGILNFSSSSNENLGGTGEIINNGEFHHLGVNTGSDNIVALAAGTFTNNGLFAFDSRGDFQLRPGYTFTNTTTGTIRKTADNDSDPAQFFDNNGGAAGTVENEGTFEVEVGTLKVTTSRSSSFDDVILPQISGTELTGGTWIANPTGANNAIIDLEPAEPGGIVTIGTNATVSLTGTGKLIQLTNFLAQIDGSLTLNNGQVLDAANTVTVSGTGTLAGDSGRIIGDLTVQSGGSLTPGDGDGDTGVLTVTGDVTLGGDLDLDINGSSFDLLDVDGGVAVGGNLILDVATEPTAFLITLIDNDGIGDATTGEFTSLNGTPTTLSDGAVITLGSKPYKIFYNGGDGNDVVLVDATAPTTIYVNADFASLSNGTLVDGDDEKALPQDAAVGVNAFSTINAAINALGTNSGTIVINSGDYSAEAVDLTTAGTDIDITLQFVEGDSQIGSLATGVSDAVVLGGFDGDHTTGVTVTLGALDNGFKEIKGVVSGTGGFTKVGTGYLKLSGDNTYSGITTVDRGRLYVGHNNALGATGESSKTIVNGADGTSSAFLYLDSATPLTINETLNLNASSAGRVSLYSNSSVVHTLAGPIDVSSTGQLVQFNSSGAGGMTITGDVTGTMTSAGFFVRGSSRNAANHIQGSFNITGSNLAKTDDGTWTLGASGAGQSYSWNHTQVARGTVILGAADVLTPGKSIYLDQNDTNADATLDLNNFDQTTAAIIFNNGGTPSTATISTGTATLTLNGNITSNTIDNTEGGVISGNLDLGGATRTMTINDSTGSEAELTISAVISNGGITKAGLGNLVLSGDSTYTGGTAVNAGSLIVNGDNSAATGAVSVASGATLAGSGTVGGLVTSNGDIQPGATPGDIVGALTFEGDLTLKEVEFDIADISIAGTDYDQVIVNGLVDVTGAELVLDDQFSGTGVAGDLITLIANDDTDAVSGIFATLTGATDDNGGTLADGDTITFNDEKWRVFYGGGDGNDVVLASAATPSVVYVDDSFTQNGGQIIDDADLGVSGNQTAIFNVNAFDNLADAFAAVGSGGKIIVNGGTYTESISLTDGKTLEITGPNAAGAVIISDLSADAGTSIVIEGSSTLTLGNGADQTIAAVLSGTGNLVKQGIGKLTLSGAGSTATGTTLVKAGILEWGANDALPSGTVTVESGATVDVTFLSGSASTGSSRAYHIAGTGSAGQGALINSLDSIYGSVAVSGLTLTADATVSTPARLDIGGAINIGNFTLTKIGGDTLAFRNTVNSPGGALVVDAGLAYIENNNMTLDTITVNDGARFGMYNYSDNTRTVTADITFNGSSKLSSDTNVDGNAQFEGTIHVNSGTLTIEDNFGSAGNDADYIINSVISGTGTIVLEGSNTNSVGDFLQLNAANTFSGTVRMTQNGPLFLGNALALQNATLDTGSSAGDSLNFGTLTAATFGGLTGSDSFVLENASAAGVALSVGNNDSNTTYSGGMSGIGSLTKIGTGTLTLSGTNSFTGGTTISSGVLSLSGGSALLDTGAVSIADLAGATLDLVSDETIGSLAGGGATGGAVTLGANTLTTGEDDTNTTFAGVVSGTGGLTKIGDGTFTVSGANTYSGDTLISAGILKLGNNSALGDEVGKTVINGGTLDIAGFRAGANGNELVEVQGTGAGGLGAINNSGGSQTSAFRRIVLTDDATFRADSRWDMRNSGGSSSFDMGGFTLTKVGAREFSIVNTTISNPGSVDVTQGIFRLEGSSDFDGTGTITVSSGANLDFWSNSRTHEVDIVLAGGAILTSSSSASYATTLNGAVTLNGVASIGSNQSDTIYHRDLVISGNVVGAGGINKIGVKAVTLTGTNNTYAGATTVSAGSLFLDGTHTGGATYTVESGAILGGTGTTDADVIVDTGGGLSPGVGGIGTLTVQDNLAINGTYTFEINGDISADLTDVTGTVTLGAASILDLVELTAGSDNVGSTVTLIANDDSDVVMGTFFNVAEGATVTDDDGEKYTISYAGGDGNDVVLFAGVAETQVALSGRVLTISDISAENADDITISYDSDEEEYVISDPNLILTTTGFLPGEFWRPDANTVRVDAGLVDSIVVNTANPTAATESDTVTVSSLPAPIAGDVEIHAEIINIGTDITTTGSQTFDGKTTLTANVTLTGTNVTFGDFLNSDAEETKRVLVVNTSGSGVTTFGSTVGGVFDLASLTTNADGSVVLGGSVTTSGSQTYNDAVSISGNRTLSGSTITLVESVTNGGSNLTVNGQTINILGGITGGGGNITLNASSGGIYVKEGITTFGAGTIKMSSIAGGSNEGILIEGDLTTEYGAIELVGRSSSGVGVSIVDSTVSTTGTSTSGEVGGNIRITGRTSNSSSNVQLEIDGTSAVTAFDGSITLRTISGDANIGGEVNSGAHVLTLESGADLNLNDVTVIGGSIDLLADKDVNISAGAAISGPAAAVGNVVLFSENFEGFTQGSTSDGRNDIVLDNGWMNLQFETLDFVSNKGGTPSGSTGPASDHTKGDSTGTYLYMETSSPKEGEFARLLSPVVDLTGQTNSSVEFYHHMYGEHIGSLLVEGTTDGGTTWTQLLILDGEQGNSWRKASVDLSAFDNAGAFQLRLTGVRGESYQGDISLDDFRFFADSGDLLVEDFEDDTEFGQGTTSGARPQQTLGAGWTNVTSSVADDFDWVPDRDGTPSSGTGPTGGGNSGSDHTTGTADGIYLYTETSGGVGTGDSAVMYTPGIDIRGQASVNVEFYYHMYDGGSGEMGTLNVYASGDGGATWSAVPVFTKTGDQGNGWLKAEIDSATLAPYLGSENFKLQFEGVDGTGYRSDISIDDVRVSGGPVATTNVRIIADADGAENGAGGAITMEDGSTVDAGDGNVILSADGDIVVSSVATTATITASAANGAIRDGGDTGTDLTASVLIATAGSGVGLGDQLDTVVDNVEADGGSGGVAIANTGDLTIGETGAGIGVTAGGTVNISSSNDLTIAASTNVTGRGINLDADNDLNILDGSQITGLDAGPLVQENFDSFVQGSTSAGATNIALGNGWVNVQGTDQIDWSPDAGGTPSGGTGPGNGSNSAGTDHTTGTTSGKYLYIETSDHVLTGETAELYSPTLDLSVMESASLEFYYHMLGVDPEMGTLKVYASTDGGMTWSSELFSVSGNQGNVWNQQVIDLAAFLGSSEVVLRFDGIAGTVTAGGGVDPGYRSDIALDDITVTGVPFVQLNATGGAITMADNSAVNAGANNVSISAEGNVTVNSVTTTGDVTVASGTGEIFDRGVTPDIAGGTVTFDGNVAPGLSGLGTLQVDGDLDLASDDVLSLELDGTTAGSGHDQVAVNGAVSVGDATLELNFGFVPTVGSTFVIVDNDASDPVAGTFQFDDEARGVVELTEGSAFTSGGQVYTISYTGGTGNDVVLTAHGEAETEVSIDGSGNLVIADINNESADRIDISIQNIGGTNYYVIKDLNATPLVLTTPIAATDANRISASEIHVRVDAVNGGLDVNTANPTEGGATDSVTISSALNFAGAVEVNAETINLDANVIATTQAYTGSVVLGTSVELDATTLTVNGSIDLGANTLTADVSTGTSSINGAITGSGNLVKQGAGKLELLGTAGNTYTGLTTVSAGELRLNNSGGNAIGGDLDITTGGKVTFARSHQIVDTAAVTMSDAGSVFNGTGVNGGQYAATETFASFTVTGGTFNTSSGIWTITGAGSFTGGAGNTTMVGNSGTRLLSFGSLALVDMNSTSGLAPNSFTLYGNSSSILSTMQIGAGGLTLDNSNLNLRHGGGGTLGSRLILDGDVTTLGTSASTIREDTSGGTSGLADIQMNGVRLFNVASGADLSVSTGVSDGTSVGSLTKTGTGQLTLSGRIANTYTGDTNINAGTLRLTQTAGINAVAADIFVNTGGTLTMATDNQIADTAGITVDGGSITAWETDETVAFYTQNSGGLPSSGNSGRVVVTGAMTLAGGNLFVINSITSASPASWTVGSASLTGADMLIGGNNGTGNPTTKFIVGSGGLSMDGRIITLYRGSSGAELILNGDFTGTGTNQIIESNSGAIDPRFALGAASRTFNVISGTTTVGMEVYGAGGSIVKSGAGTLVLVDDNTYTGTTSVSGGILRVEGTHTGGDNYNVSATGILDGSGTITLASGKRVGSTGSGSIAPGSNGIGTLTIVSDDTDSATAPNTVTLGGDFDFQINGNTNADLLNVDGTVTLGGTLDVEELTAGTGSVFTGSTIVLIDNDGSTDAVDGTFTGLPEGAVVTDDDGDSYVISYSGGGGNDVVLFAGSPETNVDLSGGVLTISDITNESADQISFTFDATNQEYVITDPNLVISTTGLTAAQVTRPDAYTVRIKASAVTGGVVIETANPTAATATDAVTFGGPGTDAIVFPGALTVKAETIVFDGNVTLGGASALTGGTATFNANTKLGVNALSLDLTGVATNASTGRFDITAGRITFLNGSEFVNEGTVVHATGGTTDFTGTGTVTNKATWSQTATGGADDNLRFNGAVTFNNEGTYELTGGGDLTLANSSAIFNNTGLFLKSGFDGNDPSFVFDARGSFNNLAGGEIRVTAGRLRFDTGGTSAATAQWNAVGGDIGIGSGTSSAAGAWTGTFAGTATGSSHIELTNAGNAAVGDGNLVIGAAGVTFDVTGNGVEWNNTTIITQGNSLTNEGNLRIIGSGINSITGGGIVTNASTGDIEFENGTLTLSSDLTNNGNIDIETTSGKTLNGGGDIVNANQATISHTGGALTIDGASGIVGQSGSTLNLTDGNLVLTNGNITSAGVTNVIDVNYVISGAGAFTNESGGTLDLTPDTASARSLTINNAGGVVNNGLTNYLGNANVTLTGTGSFTNNADFDHRGGGNDNLVLSGSVVFTNAATGTYDLLSEGDIQILGSARFDNSGLFIKTGGGTGAGPTSGIFSDGPKVLGADGSFHNLAGGTVQANVGTIHIASTGGNTSDAGATWTANGGVIQLGALWEGTFTGSSAGGGHVAITNTSNSAFEDDFTVGAAGVSFDISGDGALWDARFIDTTLGDITNLNLLVINAGGAKNLSGSNKLITANGATTTFSGGAEVRTPAAASLQIDGGGTVNGAGSFEGEVFGAAGSLIETGGTLVLGDALTNAFNTEGNIIVNAGDTLTLNDSGVAQIGAGTLVKGGGTLNAPNDLTMSAGDEISGGGDVNANLSVNSATVTPGEPGVDITQTLSTDDIDFGTGTFIVDLDGITDGDLLNVTGEVDLDASNLTIATANNLVTGSTIVIIENDLADSVVSTFNGVAEGSVISTGGNDYVVSYAGDDGNDVVLFAGTPETQVSLVGNELIITDITNDSTDSLSVTYDAVANTYTIVEANGTFVLSSLGLTSAQVSRPDAQTVIINANAIAGGITGLTMNTTGPDTTTVGVETNDKISFSTPNGPLVIAGDVVFTASEVEMTAGAAIETTGAGSVSVSGESVISLLAGATITTAGGDVTLTSDNGPVTMVDGAVINAGSGTIGITAEGDVTLGGVQTTGLVTIDSANGNIVDGGDTHREVIAGMAVLNAANGYVGDVNPLETQLSNLEGTSGANFVINNTGALNLGGASVTASGLSVDGALTITNDASIIDSEATTVGGKASIATTVDGADITLGLLDVTGTLGLNTTGPASDIAIVSAQTITFANSSAGGNFSATATSGDVNIGAGITVGSTAGNLTLNADDNLSLDVAGTLTAANGRIDITVDQVGVFDTAGSTVNLWGTVVAMNEVFINGGAEGDVFNITPSVNTEMNIDGNDPSTVTGGDSIILTGADTPVFRPTTPATDGAGVYTFSGGQKQIDFTEVEFDNVAPDFEVVGGDSAAGSLTETDAPLSVTGTLTVYDLGTVTATIDGNVGIAGSPDVLGNADFLAMFSLTSTNPIIADAATVGKVNWRFDSNTATFDFLALGETLTLTYTVRTTDPDTGTDTQTVTIKITGTNDDPVLTTDVVTVFEGGQGGSETVRGNALANDTDIDINGQGKDDVLKVVNARFDGTAFGGSTNGGGAVAPGSARLVDGLYGTLSIDADGNFVYTVDGNLPTTRALDTGDVGVETFTYRVSDGSGGFVEEKIVVRVVGKTGGKIGEFFGVGGSGILEGFRFAEPRGEGGGGAGEPLLLLMPTYSGTAEPGSVITLSVMGADGSTLLGGSMTVVADLSGGWIAKFSGLEIGNTSYFVKVAIAPPAWSTGVTGSFQVFFAPAINGSHTESDVLTVDSVMGRRLNSVALDSLIEADAHPNGSNADWRKANGIAELF